MLADPLADRIGDDQQNEADHRVEQADRRRKSIIGIEHPSSVDEGGDDIRRLVRKRTVHEQHLLAADAHHRTHVQNEHNDDGRHHSRNRNMEHLLEAPGSVDLGRFIQGRIDRGDRGQVDNGAPAQPLPDAGAYEQRPEPARLRHERNAVDAQKPKQLINQSVPRQEIEHHSHHDDNRDEMRQIRDRLHRALEDAAPNLVQQQGQYYRRGKSKQQLVHIDQDRIAKQTAEVVAVEKILEMIEADPLAAPDAVRDAVIFESHQQAVHRSVVENGVIRDNRKRQQIYIFIPLQVLLDEASLFELAAFSRLLVGR